MGIAPVEHATTRSSADGQLGVTTDRRKATPRRKVTPRRVVAMAAYCVVFGAYWRLVGLPGDMIVVVSWAWLAAICWRIDRPWLDHLTFLRDWSPLALLMIAYDISRGYADNGVRPHVQLMIDFDRWLMGGGDVPTVWLQQHLYDPNAAHWYDLLASWVYFSHFLATPVAALVLWLRNRRQWARFVRRWVALSTAGMVTYFLFPAMPPWMAGGTAGIPPVVRTSARGWDLIGLHSANHVLAQAQDLSNPVAAMPSLHGGFALFVVAFFLPVVRRRWWPLLLAFPAAMTFTLLYCGEHWAADLIAGFAYVGGVYLAVGGAERAWARWRASHRRATRPGAQVAAASPESLRPADDGSQ